MKQKLSVQNLLEPIANIFKKKTTNEILIENQKRAIKRIEEYRELYIPKIYNQALPFENIFNDNIDYIMSISSRTDGKTFNYIGLASMLAYEFNTGFTIVVSHFSLRKPMFHQVLKVYKEVEYFDEDQVNYIYNDLYLLISYKGKIIGIITDLRAVSDIKFTSNSIVDFPIIIVEEFLKLEDEYLPDEPERLKMLYESMDRDFSNDPKKIVQNPKVIYLGNAINFASPILAYHEVFYYLETQEMNTIRQYDNLILELIRNDNTNEKRNTRAFNKIDNYGTTGEFNFNSHLIIKKEENNLLNSFYREFRIRLRDRELLVRYNNERKIYLLSIVLPSEKYILTTQLNHLKKNVRYIDDKYYKNKFVKNHIKGVFLYANAYSKKYILECEDLIYLNLFRCIGYNESLHKSKDINTANENLEIYNNVNYERILKNLSKKFF